MSAAAPVRGALSRGAILLAGGRASRMGGIAKPLLRIGGVTLLDRAIAAGRDAGCAPITIVGPAADGVEADDLAWVREDPPFTGPAAAAVAAIATWTAPGPEWAFLLACDLPRVGAAVARLSADLALLPSDADGMCLGDASSRPQWLTGVYRTTALRAASSRLADAGRDLSVRALLADLAITVVPAPGDTADIDTWEDYRKECDDG